MNKFIKSILGCLITGVTIGLFVSAIKKVLTGKHIEEDIFEEDDFDLDKDLQPVKEREYVSLNRTETL